MCIRLSHFCMHNVFKAMCSSVVFRKVIMNWKFYNSNIVSCWSSCIFNKVVSWLVLLEKISLWSIAFALYIIQRNWSRYVFLINFATMPKSCSASIFRSNNLGSFNSFNWIQIYFLVHLCDANALSILKLLNHIVLSKYKIIGIYKVDYVIKNKILSMNVHFKI